MSDGRWRRAGGTLLRVISVWAVSTLTMLVLAGALPDFQLQADDGDTVTRTAFTAAWGAGAFGLLSALVWPVLVRALLIVPALVLGALVFFLNGSLLLIALRLIPDGRGDANPETAVVVAAVMSAVASATSTALAVRDDDAYRRRLSRLADRRRRRSGTPQSADGGRGGPPGIVFVQLDGVGHDVLEQSAADGLMPTVAGLLADEAGHRLTPWTTDWSSQTGASQLGILHGSNFDVPAFRWFEKETGTVMVSSRPASALELQRRAIARTHDGGLLTVDGASRGNLFSGGADQLALVLSMAARLGKGRRSRAGYFAYFSDPANAVRTALSFAAEVGREVGQSLRARVRKESPRVKRGGLYPFIRAFATVVERDVVVAAVIGDMFAGRTAVYADLVAYDEVAHHSGPHSRDAEKVLTRLDRSLGLILKIADHTPRGYRIVLLSDHGQSPGETFAGRYGLTLKDLVRAGCGLPVPRRAQRTRSASEARDAVRIALHRPVAGEQEAEHPAKQPSDPVVLASGNLGLLSFPDIEGRASREQLDRRYPALLATLAAHPGIGFLLVRSQKHGSVVLGRDGAEVPVAELTDGEGPIAAFGAGAADAVRRTDGFPHVADVMVNSMYDAGTGRVHAFEEQIGSHGGLGGEQSRPFLLWPRTLADPLDVMAAEGGSGGTRTGPVGAEAVHRVLRRWIGELSGPQVPLRQEGLTGAEAADEPYPEGAGDPEGAGPVGAHPGEPARVAPDPDEPGPDEPDRGEQGRGEQGPVRARPVGERPEMLRPDGSAGADVPVRADVPLRADAPDPGDPVPGARG